MNPLAALRQKIVYNRVLRDAVQRLLLTEPGVPSSLATVMLGHFRNFCYADESTVKPDALQSAVAQGRREVWLELQYYLNLPEAELINVDRQYRHQMEQIQQRGLDS